MWGTVRQQLKRHRCRFQVIHFNGLDDFPKTCTPHRTLEKECGHYGKAWAEVKQISANCEWRHVGVVDACTIPHQWLNGDHILLCSITVLYHVVLGQPIRWQSRDSESHCMPPLAVELSSFLNMWHIHYHLYLLINTPMGMPTNFSISYFLRLGASERERWSLSIHRNSLNLISSCIFKFWKKQRRWI